MTATPRLSESAAESEAAALNVPAACEAAAAPLLTMTVAVTTMLPVVTRSWMSSGPMPAASVAARRAVKLEGERTAHVRAGVQVDAFVPQGCLAGEHVNMAAVTIGLQICFACKCG